MKTWSEQGYRYREGRLFRLGSARRYLRRWDGDVRGDTVMFRLLLYRIFRERVAVGMDADGEA